MNKARRRKISDLNGPLKRAFNSQREKYGTTFKMFLRANNIPEMVTGKVSPAKGKVVKLYTLDIETLEFLEKEFKNFKNGLGVDELVRQYKLMKGI